MGSQSMPIGMAKHAPLSLQLGLKKTTVQSPVKTHKRNGVDKFIKMAATKFVRHVEHNVIRQKKAEEHFEKAKVRNAKKERKAKAKKEKLRKLNKRLRRATLATRGIKKAMEKKAKKRVARAKKSVRSQ